MRELLIQNWEAHSLFLQLSYNYWIQYSLFTWQWWLLVVILVVPWYFWWRMVDKRRLLEIWCYGVMTFVAVLGADAIGVAYGCWIYPIRLSPKFPHILSVDTTVLPIVYMLIYQSFPKWTNFIMASTIMSACFAFVGEPITVWTGVYELLTWKYYYSLPLYILFAAGLKFIIETIKSIQSQNDLQL
jgi:hypothetical protein